MYRKMEHTIYFVSNGSFIVGYHRFPVLVHLYGYPEYLLVRQYTINTNCTYSKLHYYCSVLLILHLPTLATHYHLFELSNPSYEYIDDNQVCRHVNVHICG